MMVLHEKVRLFTRFLKSLMGRVLKAVSVRLVRGAFCRAAGREAGVQRHRAGEERWGVSSEATVVVVVALWWRRA
jgi:hypothetical protein